MEIPIFSPAPGAVLDGELETDVVVEATGWVPAVVGDTPPSAAVVEGEPNVDRKVVVEPGTLDAVARVEAVIEAVVVVEFAAT